MNPDMRLIENCAVGAATRCFSTFLPLQERYEIALGAIYEEWCCLVAGNEVPYPTRLYSAGVRAISVESNDWKRHLGLQDNDRGFATYWWDIEAQHGLPRPYQVISRLALVEVMAQLPERHQEALIGLAMHGNPQDAARAAGCTYGAMQKRIKVARLEFYRLWFDWETPPAPTFDRRTAKLDTHCGRGHEFTPENTRYRRATNGRGQKRACRACDVESLARRKERAA